jgi:polyisoprenoid-binding protein YceI
MKKNTIFALALSLAALAVPAFAQSAAQASIWRVDKAHSEVAFKIRHLAIAYVNGRFAVADATLLYNEKDVTKSSVTATIDVPSISTGEPARDTHLKSPDFFDVAKFPTATFVSTKIVKTDGGLIVVGDFTLHGVTKNIKLVVDGPTKAVTDPYGKTHVGFSATGTINRQDFGLTWAKSTATGEALVGDEVKLSIDLDLIKQ